MRAQANLINNIGRLQVIRYVINGLFATVVHFGALTFNLQIIGMNSAGLANMYAAMAGITASFFGSRYFVYCKRQEVIYRQAVKFGLLYAFIAGLHGIVLYIWSDLWEFDYRIGFILATGVQVVLSYWGNLTLVFKK